MVISENGFHSFMTENGYENNNGKYNLGDSNIVLSLVSKKKRVGPCVLSKEYVNAEGYISKTFVDAYIGSLEDENEVRKIKEHLLKED